ncbi:MAG TPA: type I glyceraldehyde-3-phosphate dehydrogenase [Micromonosporaceae bacterium]|nr:type I glyceraldehyde-3-phosphate dehydrogenase [Micromonosporaceae bacterium]
MVRVGINGCGRIGRAFWRASLQRPDIDVVAVNDVAMSPSAIAHLLQYDSVHGRHATVASAENDRVVLDGRSVPVGSNPRPGDTPWGDLGVDLVLESTGRFFRADALRGHLKAGAERVLISAAAPDPDATIIIGVNDPDYDPARHRIVSPACCTSNAAAPVIAVLRSTFGVKSVYLNTVHAYDVTASALHDSPHRDRRMGRAAALNIVPARITDTTRSLGYVFPDLADSMHGTAMRVPTGIGCNVELIAELDRAVDGADINVALAAAASGAWKGRFGYTDEPLVSSDFIGMPEVSVVDSLLTHTMGRNAKVVVWHDNEIGYARILCDAVELLSRA